MHQVSPNIPQDVRLAVGSKQAASAVKEEGRAGPPPLDLRILMADAGVQRRAQEVDVNGSSQLLTGKRSRQAASSGNAGASFTKKESLKALRAHIGHLAAPGISLSRLVPVHRPVCFPTGIPDLDAIIGNGTTAHGTGLAGGQITALCGTPHVGKSFLAVHCAASSLIDRVLLNPSMYPNFTKVHWISGTETSMKSTASAMARLISNIFTTIEAEAAEELTQELAQGSDEGRGGLSQRVNFGADAKINSAVGRCMERLQLYSATTPRALSSILDRLQEESLGVESVSQSQGPVPSCLVIVDDFSSIFNAPEVEPPPESAQWHSQLLVVDTHAKIQRFLSTSMGQSAVLLTTWAGRVTAKAQRYQSREAHLILPRSIEALPPTADEGDKKPTDDITHPQASLDGFRPSGGAVYAAMRCCLVYLDAVKVPYIDRSAGPTLSQGAFVDDEHPDLLYTAIRVRGGPRAKVTFRL